MRLSSMASPRPLNLLQPSFNLLQLSINLVQIKQLTLSQSTLNLLQLTINLSRIKQLTHQALVHLQLAQVTNIAAMCWPRLRPHFSISF